MKYIILLILSLCLFIGCGDKGPIGIEGDKDMDYKQINQKIKESICFEVPNAAIKTNLYEEGYLKNYPTPSDSGNPNCRSVSSTWNEHSYMQSKYPLDIAGGGVLTLYPKKAWAYHEDLDYFPHWLTKDLPRFPYAIGNGSTAYNTGGPTQYKTNLGASCADIQYDGKTDIYEKFFTTWEYLTSWESPYISAALDLTILRDDGYGDPCWSFVTPEGKYQYRWLQSNPIIEGPFRNNFPDASLINITAGLKYGKLPESHNVAFSTSENSYLILCGWNWPNMSSSKASPGYNPIGDVAYNEKRGELWIVLNQNNPYGGAIFYTKWEHQFDHNNPWYQYLGLGFRIGIDSKGSIFLLNRERKVFVSHRG